MRQIENAMVQAVNARKNFAQGNTRVEVSKHDQDGNSWELVVYLHGNAIYTKGSEKGEWFTLADWNTATTRSRLRALGVDVCQRKGAPYYNGEEISDNKWYQV